MESDSEEKKSKMKSLKSINSDVGKTDRKAELSLKDVIKLTPHFDGTNLTFKEWADTLERNLALANIGDSLGEILFGSILINKAKIVWEMAEVSTRISIKLSLKVLKGHFDNNTTRLEAGEKIHSTKQANFSSVLEYVKEQIKNCKAVESNMDEETIIANIRRNLSPEFKKQLFLFDFKNVDQLLLALDRVEKNLQSEKPKEVNFTSHESKHNFSRNRGFRGGRYEGRGRGPSRAPVKINRFVRGKGRSLANVQCYNCGNFGHTQKFCHPNRQVNVAEGSHSYSKKSVSKPNLEVEGEEEESNKDDDSI